ncbi:hypothetical protein P7H17_05220 [Paenibacillus larvae]|nr:hypothetical protein [Paenibacillus larvae]MDT2285616.1 hypothetical protein [Paenibacillus larvae]
MSSYIHTYENGGLELLTVKHSSGAPTRCSKQQQDRLKQAIAYSVPHEVGFCNKHNWTNELIATYVGERDWGHCYSLQAFPRSWSGWNSAIPETDHARSSRSRKQRHFTETTFPELKKLNEEIDHLLFEDESMIRDYQAIRRPGSFAGSNASFQPRASIVGSNHLAPFDEQDTHSFWQEDEQYTAETFLSFL